MSSDDWGSWINFKVAKLAPSLSGKFIIVKDFEYWMFWWEITKVKVVTQLQEHLFPGEVLKENVETVCVYKEKK